eukprot:scaffold1019_cov324-Prasinococcus_capsulatus_cf.AAC.3
MHNTLAARRLPRARGAMGQVSAHQIVPLAVVAAALLLRRLLMRWSSAGAHDASQRRWRRVPRACTCGGVRLAQVGQLWLLLLKQERLGGRGHFYHSAQPAARYNK